MSIEEVILLLVVIGLAVVAVRGLVSRSGKARWSYLAGLVAGAGLGVGIALETDGLWTWGLALGLGASVVGAAAVEAVTARIRGSVRHVPRRPGHDEDV